MTHLNGVGASLRTGPNCNESVLPMPDWYKHDDLKKS